MGMFCQGCGCTLSRCICDNEEHQGQHDDWSDAREDMRREEREEDEK